eukprot:10662348-Karenia_brevis.AAC.1
MGTAPCFGPGSRALGTQARDPEPPTQAAPISAHSPLVKAFKLRGSAGCGVSSWAGKGHLRRNCMRLRDKQGLVALAVM